MNHKINASTLVTRHTLEVSDTGVEFAAAHGTPRNFRFDEIVAVLRSAESLSFQVGEETFRIPIKADSAAHRAVATRLASEVRRTVRRRSQ
ncbi:MAG TPA: hypothetical protein VMU84_08960 [Thermoanaerobaculia bacterium]|nr:hypothetical protein [Thermoanaerobaculia bacterium]